MGGSTIGSKIGNLCSTGKMHWPPQRIVYLCSNHFSTYLQLPVELVPKLHTSTDCFFHLCSIESLFRTITSNPMTANSFCCSKQNFSCCTHVQNVSLFCPTPLIGSTVTWTNAIAIKKSSSFEQFANFLQPFAGIFACCPLLLFFFFFLLDPSASDSVLLSLVRVVCAYKVMSEFVCQRLICFILTGTCRLLASGRASSWRCCWTLFVSV